MHDNEIERYSKFLLITSQTVNLLLLFAVTGTQGLLTHTPTNSVAQKGNTNVFTCCTDIVQKTIFWKHKPVGSAHANDIYDSNGFVNGFLSSGRFSVTPGSSHGCHSLTITSLSLEDGGTYICADAEGLGQMMGWELVILESFNCQEMYPKAEYMGDNDLGLPQDVISASCISKYFGNVRPKPICELFSGTQSLENYYHAIETNSTTTLNINIPAKKEFSGDQLLCYVKIEAESRANQRQIVWNSTRFNINYVLFQQKCASQCNGDISSLGCDCQPPCSYKMEIFQNSSLYCEITYSVKPDRTFKVVLTEHTDSQAHQVSPSVTLTVVTTALVSVLICCVLAVATAAAIIMLKRKKCQRRDKDMHEVNTLDPVSNREKCQRRDKDMHEVNTLDPVSNRDSAYENVMVRTSVFHQPTTLSTPMDERCLMEATSLLQQLTTLSPPGSMATMEKRQLRRLAMDDEITLDSCSNRGARSSAAWRDSGVDSTDDG